MKLFGFNITRAPTEPADTRQSPENPSTPLSNPASWLWPALGAQPVSSGVNVSENNVLSIATFWSCVRLISETIASLPFGLYERTETGRQFVPGPLSRMVGLQPNEVQTSMGLREVMQAHALTRGNAHCFIDRDGATRPRGLYLLDPTTTYAERLDARRTIYRSTLYDGTQVTLGDYEVLHLQGLSGDGLNGYSVVQTLRESLGLAMATQEYGARFFSGDAKTEGVLEVPQVLSGEGYDNIRREWQQSEPGLAGRHRIKILEQGTKYQAISIPPDDAQFLETRDFQRQDIAAAMRVPGYMVGIDSDGGGSRASTEQKALEFVKFGIRPWLVRWEQECYRKLLPSTETRRYFHHNLEGLLRGDFATQSEGFAKGRQFGWLSANDIRRLLDMPTIGEQGDIYQSSHNMLPADRVDEFVDAQIASKTPAENTGEADNRTLRIIRASCRRLAEREADALQKAVARHLPNDPAGFDAWYETFTARHGANLRDALCINPATYLEDMRQTLSGPRGLTALDSWAEMRTQKLLEAVENARDT